MITKHAPDHHSLHTEVTINAPAAEVWAVLTDFDNMPNWSPVFKGVKGDCRDGGQVSNHFEYDGNEIVGHKTLKMVDGKSFGWEGESEAFLSLNAKHFYIVAAIDEDTTPFMQTEVYRGGNENMSTKQLAEMAMPVYDDFNVRLKAEVEKS